MLLQANSQGTSGESRMPGYHFFKQATGDFSQKIGKGQFGKVYKVPHYELQAHIAQLLFLSNTFT